MRTLSSARTRFYSSPESPHSGRAEFQLFKDLSNNLVPPLNAEARGQSKSDFLKSLLCEFLMNDQHLTTCLPFLGWGLKAVTRSRSRSISEPCTTVAAWGQLRFLVLVTPCVALWVNGEEKQS